MGAASVQACRPPGSLSSPPKQWPELLVRAQGPAAGSLDTCPKRVHCRALPRPSRVRTLGASSLLLGQTCASVGRKDRPRVDGSEA